MDDILKPGLMNLVIDLQWGSTGKGAISRYLAGRDNIDAALCHFSPNSAHTSVEADGTANIVKQLPQAAVMQDPDIELLIGADSCINLDVLMAEIDKYKVASHTLHIHPNAVIITDACKKYEEENLVRISSTLQGTSAAKSMKLMRSPDVLLAKDCEQIGSFVSHHFDDLLGDILGQNETILGDFHQGYQLSVNSQFYPYVTSSTVNTSQFMASCNLPPSKIGTVVGVCRVHPIRVGNVKDVNGNIIGYSGDVYPDMEELSWDEVTEMSGSPRSLQEMTTLTKKVRRIFTWSDLAHKDALRAVDPDMLFLNFVNYIDYNDYGKQKYSELSTKTKQFIEHVSGLGVPVKFVGTGPQNNHIIEL